MDNNNKKILLVAKPWKGGLARYLFFALDKMFPGKSEWIPTYPVTIKDRIYYQKNKNKWRLKTAERIKKSDYKAAIFIGMFESFSDIQRHDRNILWLPDGPNFNKNQLSPYGRIFLSDSGYEDQLLNEIESFRYGGELTFAHLPQIHFPYSDRIKKKKDICFIGNKDSRRDPYIKYLFQMGFRPDIIGNYFLSNSLAFRYPLYFKPSITNEKMGEVYAGHKIALNIHANIIKCGTNMRTFECAGYGTPQLVDYKPKIELYFEPGKEVLVYNTKEEMIINIKRLLKDENFAKNISQNARRRVLAEHTYYHRVLTLLDGIFSKGELSEAFSNAEIGSIGK